MNLHNVVARYQTETFTDPYGLSPALTGAIRPFAEVTNSGPSSRRRILETLPGVTIPTDSAVRHGGVTYIVGGKNVDYWRNEEIRWKYPILPCDLTMRTGSVAQILASTLPAKIYYCYPHFVRGSVLDTESSEVWSNFSLYCSMAVPLNRNSIILTSAGKYYRLRSAPFFDGAQFQVAEALELDAPLQSLTYVRNTGYDPVTDTITSGGSTVTPCFVEDAYLAYDHTSERHAHLEPGDKTITLKPAQPVRAGETVGEYKILTIDMDADGCSVCHCRR